MRRVERGTRGRLHMIGNAHLDVVWLWQAAEGLQEVKATFRSALDRMREYPDFRFAASSAAYYDWVERNDPAMFEEIRERVAEGRWEPVGGWWVEPDCNLPGGEALARQALLGQRYFESRFGRAATVGWNVDSFGHPGTLPQLLARSGLARYVFMRPMPNEKGLPARAFWWEGDDGSRVLAYRVPFEYCTPGGDVAQHVRRVASELREPLDELMCLYGVGNHGGGPTRGNLDAIQRLAAVEDGPAIELGGVADYFDLLVDREVRLPTVHDELQHHAVGCYSAHSGIKAANRRAENALLAAEKLATVARRVASLPYPAGELERGWKSVLFNQFHDILAGTSVEPACEEALHAYGEAMAVAGRATTAALQALNWQIDIEQVDGSIPIVVWNPHSFPLRDCVELESAGGSLRDVRVVDHEGADVRSQLVTSVATVGSGRGRLAFVADVPALGYRVYRTLPRDPHGPPHVAAARDGATVEAPDEVTVEAGHYRLSVDPATGFVSSLWDRRHEVEVLAGPGARPVVLSDESDTWSHDVHRYDSEAGCFEPVSVRRTEAGAVKTVLRVESRFNRSRLTQDFTLYEVLDRIDVRVTLDWRESHRLLKLRWPVNCNFRRASYEAPFGRTVRATNGLEEPGQSWFDLSGVHRVSGELYGLSIVNDAKYAYDVLGRDMGMTVVRSPVYAHHDPFRPDSWDGLLFMDQGVQKFTYSLFPHAGGWEDAGTVREALALNQRLLPVVDTGHRGALPSSCSFLEVFPSSVVLTALKGPEEGSDAVIVRCFETCGSRTRATITMPGWGRSFERELGPFEVRTYQVPRDPRQPVTEVDLVERPVG